MDPVGSKQSNELSSMESTSSSVLNSLPVVCPFQIVEVVVAVLVPLSGVEGSFLALDFLVAVLLVVLFLPDLRLPLLLPFCEEEGSLLGLVLGVVVGSVKKF